MPIFKYVAHNQHGEKMNGKVEAPSQSQAAVILRERNLFLIDLKPVGSGTFLGISLTIETIRFADLVNFTRQLSTMITAGLTLIEGLSILNQQAKGPMKKMVDEVLREIEGGGSFAKALESQGNTFSKVYIQLVKAGETAGVLDEVLERLAETMEKQKEFASKTKGALIYPTIVIIVMAIVGFIMMVFVVPKLTQMYKDLGATLPLTTQVLIGISNLCVNYWWAIIGGVIAGGVAFQSWRKVPRNQLALDNLQLKLPILGVLRQKIILTEFCRTMGLLLGAGISVLQSLEILMGALGNKVYEADLKQSRDEVEKGVALSQSIGRFPVFPPILSQMIKVGEETGKLDEVLLKLSVYFEAESEQAVKNMTSAMEPAIMVVLGLGVGLMVMAIILPIYNITASF